MPKSTSTTPVALDQVLRLDVAVDDLLLVHVLERLARVPDVLHRLLQRQARVAALLEHGAEVGALDELHDQVLAGLVLEVLEHAHDARVAQDGQQAGLDLEALGVAPVGEVLERDLDARLARPARGRRRPSRRSRSARR